MKHLIAILFACSILSGCGAACQTERSIVDALGLGVTAADALLDEDADDALRYAAGAAQLGRVAVDVCDMVRDPEDRPTWDAWVSLALDAARDVVALFAPPDTTVRMDSRDAPEVEPVPEDLAEAVRLLESEVR